MPTCFVIQPFDGGPFDRRFDTVIKPAIESAHLEAYRVDRDPAASIPIDEIERKIRAAEVCLADITQPNPNVWFELGFAIAAGKPVVVVCQQDATKRLPFDIQHRKITFYETQSPADFTQLASRITERLVAEVAKAREQAAFEDAAVVADVSGLTIYEMTAIGVIAEEATRPQGEVVWHEVKDGMLKKGLTKLAFTTAIAGLMRKDLIIEGQVEGDYGHTYSVYQLSERGIDWLLANQDRLKLEKDPPPDDDVPF